MKIVLPKLHKNQQIIFDDPHRFKVVCAGRRFGKSRLALTIALDLAVNKGKRVGWISPTYKQSDKQWRETKRLFMNKELWTYKSERDRRLEFFVDGREGELVFMSGDRPDNIRGEGWDYIIIDEAAFVHPTLWGKVIRPAMTDRKGSAIFISTPNGRNWFYKLFLQGLPENAAAFPKWKSFHFTSYDNVAIRGIREEINDAKKEMTDLEFRQEHMAEFLDDVGTLFRGVSKVAIARMRTQAVEGHTYVMGIDWGRKHDATVITVVDATTSEQIYMDRFTETGWALQRGRVMNAINLFHPRIIHAEENSIGQPVIEQLRSEGVRNIVPFVTSGTSKGPLVDALALAIERGDIHILDEANEFGEIQANELKAYTMHQTRSGHWQYDAPVGFMDDTVIALALAWAAIKTQGPGVTGTVSNPFYDNDFLDPMENTNWNVREPIGGW